MFCSRDAIYRNPVGAVQAGQAIHFKVKLPREENCSAVYLIVEYDGGETELYGLFWCGMAGQHEEWWECDYLPKTSGLYFYHFELKTQHGHRNLYKGNGSYAVSKGASKWQITVYERKYQIPEWLKGGVIYQIFPDRFYRAGEPLGVLHDRKIHEQWDEQPVWKPDERGVITNKDYFGGNLKGIEEKLPYLEGLGVTCIYLNPIFEAHSNHRYDTADYSKIDPMLGDEADFISLCEAADKLGIGIVLDGVFSHTGSDSVYFNRDGRYEAEGAFRTKESPYYSWYTFKEWPMQYDSWWGFETLPNVNETNPDYNEYINGADGIVRKWLRAGARGWRLDVADELPDIFIENLTKAAKAEKADALVLGEVWEDASNKCSYGKLRSYLLGKQLDTVMNYPFKDAILSYIKNGEAEAFYEEVENILENYPIECVHCLMNHIGTHDTERAITMLAGDEVGGNGRAWQSKTFLTEKQKDLGIKRLKLAALIQYTLPGVPCLYYGDEAGVEGYKDPFNRGSYPWGRENKELLEWYRQLGALRRGRGRRVFQAGGFQRIYKCFVPLSAEQHAYNEDILAFKRILGDPEGEESVLVFLNRSERSHSVASELIKDAVLLLGDALKDEAYVLHPYCCAVFYNQKRSRE